MAELAAAARHERAAASGARAAAAAERASANQVATWADAAGPESPLAGYAAECERAPAMAHERIDAVRAATAAERVADAARKRADAARVIAEAG